MTGLVETIWHYRLHVVAAGAALLASLVLTPLVRYLTRRLAIMDHPDNYRKLHDRPTPLGGGIAVLGAFLVSVLLVIALSDTQRAHYVSNPAFMVGILVSGFVMCAVGFLDDWVGLSGRQKLAGQLFAASLLLVSGFCVNRIALFGHDIDLGLSLGVPFTLFWLLGATNSLNFLDGVDGLATSVGIVLSLAIATMAACTGHSTEAFLAVAMAGALAGFLVYNSPPASVFLGDAGSMLIGLVLGALAIGATLKGPVTVALVAPIAIWAIPIFDVSMAILRRKLTGRSICATDRGHLHHSLLRRGLSSRTTVAIVGLVCGLTAVAGVGSVFVHNEWLACGTVIALLSVLVLTGVFGQHESQLLLAKGKRFLGSLIPLEKRGRVQPRELEARLQGNRQWDELWKTLTQFAERFQLHTVQLNVHLPAMDEDYHAIWQRHDTPQDVQLWHSDIPLIADNLPLGRLRISGLCTGGSMCSWMGDLIAGLKPFETQMLEIVADCTGSDGRAESERRVASAGVLADRES